MAGRKGSLIYRFERMYMPEPMSGCWLWLGVPTSADGYANINVDGVLKRAHRVSWELHRGSIPKGQWVLHRCDNPACVNPDHLFLGTAQNNVNDMYAKGRARTGFDVKSAVLTDDDVRSILTDNMGARELGRVFGVAHSTIVRIRNGEKRRHVL